MNSSSGVSPSAEVPALQELEKVFTSKRDHLRRMIGLRMDRRLKGRVDASDVIQEAYLEAAQRFAGYRKAAEVSVFVWLRFLTIQKLVQVHRRHLGVKARDIGREISVYQGSMPAASSALLAAQLVGNHTSPTQAARRAETRKKIQEVLNQMSDLDREVLALRHFEQLNNAEIAQVLDIGEAACYKRYVRALKRLKALLGTSSDLSAH